MQSPFGRALSDALKHVPLEWAQRKAPSAKWVSNGRETDAVHSAIWHGQVSTGAARRRGYDVQIATPTSYGSCPLRLK
jgi:hypothetical protein